MSSIFEVMCVGRSLEDNSLPKCWDYFVVVGLFYCARIFFCLFFFPYDVYNDWLYSLLIERKKCVERRFYL